MSDKVEFDLEDLDDLKDVLGDERKGASFSCFSRKSQNSGKSVRRDIVQFAYLAFHDISRHQPMEIL